jgi:hypothetical protein
VASDDGTSNLILQGCSAFVSPASDTRHSFVAQIEALDSIVSSTVKTEALGAKVLELCERFKVAGRQLPDRIDRYLSDLSNPEMLADLMARRLLTTRYVGSKCSKSFPRSTPSARDSIFA